DAGAMYFQQHLAAFWLRRWRIDFLQRTAEFHHGLAAHAVSFTGWCHSRTRIIASQPATGTHVPRPRIARPSDLRDARWDRARQRATAPPYRRRATSGTDAASCGAARTPRQSRLRGREALP